MDEQRLQAYVGLIEQLLGCPQGQEAKFLLETLQLVADSKKNPQQIYLLWAQQQAQLDSALLEVLPQVVAQLYEQNAEQRTTISADLADFGDLIQQFPLGNPWLNIELGIAAYELALQVRTRRAFPVDWAEIQSALANAYSERIRGERADNLEQAIVLFEEALHVLTRDEFPVGWARVKNNLALTYSERIRGERADNLERAIEIYEQALQVFTREAFPEDWARAQNNLALAYSERIRGERADNLERAIEIYEQVLQIYTQDSFPEQWAMTHNNLAFAYSNRIRGERASNLEQAIRTHKQILQVYTRGAFPERWAMTQNNLAFAYSNRIYGERANNLEQAIESCDQALQVYSRDTFPRQWARTQNILANIYSDRIRGERADNLEQAIENCGQALEVFTREAFPEDWARMKNTLANVYSNRIYGERADNLEQAIMACEQALQVYTRDAFSEKWAMTQNILANAYSDRICGERADNLERAIADYEQTLQVYTQEAFPTFWAMTKSNLALAYSKRIRRERADNLEQAITAYRCAFQVYIREAFPEDWARTQNNLAFAYNNRIRGERANNLEQAIAACEQALQVYTLEAFPEDWAMTQNNLAFAYSNRIYGDRTDNFEQAIAVYENTLQVYTYKSFPTHWARAQNNLALAYNNRIAGERANNLEHAIVYCKQALRVYTQEAFPEEWAMTQNNLANAYSYRIKGKRADNLEHAIATYEQALQVYTHNAFPKDCQQTARNLGNLHFGQQAWSNAASAYVTALNAAEVLYQSCILLDGKTAELAETGDLPRFTAYALARSGDLPKAAEVLEQGCARGLSESLDRDRANLEQLNQLAPNLYTQYVDITTQLRVVEAQQRDHATSGTTIEETRQIRQSLTPEAHRIEATRLHQSLDGTITQIRQVEGYTDFLDQRSFNAIQTALQPNQPLVYLAPTSAGSLALIITPGGIADLWLDDLTSISLINQLNNTWFAAYEQSQSDRQAWLNAIDTVTHQLWQPLMAPLIRHLQAHNCRQAILIPTGYLGLLPLHAAWVEDATHPTGRRYALDDIHFTYAPNAKSLTAATAIANRTTPASILAIDNPTQNLKNSEREVQSAIASFSQHTVLKHAAATVEKVRSQLPHADIVHFSCHGKANLNDPLNSGLLMSDGLLTLKDIFDLKLGDRGGIRLAILSACETGLAGIENADEAISLPTGLLQAGVAGVVASLWSVSDLSTMMLLTRFYDLWRIEGLEIAQALRQAQQWVRDTTNSEKIAYFKDFTPDQSAAKMPASTADYLYKSLILSRPDARDFAHPFHWAAFSYVGV